MSRMRLLQYAHSFVFNGAWLMIGVKAPLKVSRKPRYEFMIKIGYNKYGRKLVVITVKNRRYVEHAYMYAEAVKDWLDLVMETGYVNLEVVIIQGGRIAEVVHTRVPITFTQKEEVVNA